MSGFLLNMPIPISQLPPDLVFGGQIDISNPIKKTKYERLNREYEQRQRTAAPSPVAPLGPSAADREAFFGKQRGEEQEFLGRFRTEFPEILTGIEEQLGLPGLRGRAQSLTSLSEELHRAFLVVQYQIQSPLLKVYLLKIQPRFGKEQSLFVLVYQTPLHRIEFE